ncbi:MAG: UDP-N-acetylmuramoyl-tripeptide--D-alanyl-D-alanine ligase [Saprospiraceae bacterium]
MMDVIKDKLYPAFLLSKGISTDTRNIAEGNLFFALKGPNFNGNEFAEKAIKAGASWAVLDEKQVHISDQKKVIYVVSVPKALQQLSTFHRSQLKAKLIAITGSNGKTTTKELLYHILKSYDKNTFCTKGNLNNHIGVPLTLLSIPMSAKYAIVEMGSNQPGDIVELCEITHPDVGLITNIGKTHLEKLKTQQGVFKEKSSLYRNILKHNGTFFLNKGDSFLLNLESKITIGYSSNHTQKTQIITDPNKLALTFTLVNDNQTKKVHTKLFGKYNIENIAAALAISEFYNVPMNISTQAIENYIPSNMRSQIIHTEQNTIVLDAYNSNPHSLNESLGHFTEADVGRKIAILGDMLELGQSSKDEHQKVIKWANYLGDITFMFVGMEFYENFVSSTNCQFFKTTEDCLKQIKKVPIINSNILLKGSRGIALEKLLPHLE